MAEFLYMGGYGFYVWCSYGLVAGVLAYHYVQPRLRRKKLLDELGAEHARKAARPKSRAPRA